MTKVHFWFKLRLSTHCQIGSYFGAELCSVDINSDSNTDFLLVGAPLFYQPQEKREGQVYVYTLTDEVGTATEPHIQICDSAKALMK